MEVTPFETEESFPTRTSSTSTVVVNSTFTRFSVGG